MEYEPILLTAVLQGPCLAGGSWGEEGAVVQDRAQRLNLM